MPVRSLEREDHVASLDVECSIENIKQAIMCVVSPGEKDAALFGGRDRSTRPGVVISGATVGSGNYGGAEGW